MTRDEFSLEALGTHWTILVEDAVVSSDLRRELTTTIQDFDSTYSRFKPGSFLSQLNQLQTDKPQTIPRDLQVMLAFGYQLYQATHGLFDPNVTSWEAAYGYDQSYTFAAALSDAPVDLPTKGTWELVQGKLLKHGAVQLDLGAFGKGYLIDLLAQQLQDAGITHFLIDGGRDFWGSSKADGSAWQIALEHPTDSTAALGVAPLYNQALAASSSFHRRVGNFHHLLNGQTGQPVAEIASVFVTAKTAMKADGLSTAIFTSTPEIWQELQSTFEFEYVVLTADMHILHSQQFAGEVF